MTQKRSSLPGGPTLRILLSRQCAQRLGPRIGSVLGDRPHELVIHEATEGSADADIAFVSRDVTGLSTKHEVHPSTQAFFDAMLGAPSLQWVHTHSAGADRPVYVALRSRRVVVTTSSGANASVVAQTALAGILALARHFPLLAGAQSECRWAPLIQSGMPRDLAGQTATIVGWGPIGQTIGAYLSMLGLRVIAVRRSATPSPPAAEAVVFDALHGVLPRTDWLVLACPLTPTTQNLIDRQALSLLPRTGHLVNVSRGEVVDEAALCEALQEKRLAGAFLDVFAHEPLSPASPLWALPNTIVTPHSAGFSDGNRERVESLFLDNLGRWITRAPLANVASSDPPA
ncbi:Phosphoglycerate dehydrogenase [Noviherbaspirillum humi]|uniref:Phosphoglycerate dehydrogenase n=1 Tax=Noviherbaspirillum humi TaxID=1688639 RepID=A0A239JN29_9BURK|nr:D-2-hydroxyacid dehydrogenase [Noviherbaspirillum humi]SNT07426.1 Phosphoglycerate dehydrogenase [Noviherbaspirillum humi]